MRVNWSESDFRRLKTPLSGRAAAGGQKRFGVFFTTPCYVTAILLWFGAGVRNLGNGNTISQLHLR